MLSLMIWPNKNNILNFEDPVTGDKLPLFSSNPNSDYDNPFFNVYNNVARDVTMRATTSLGININPTSWLSVLMRDTEGMISTYFPILVVLERRRLYRLKSLLGTTPCWSKMDPDNLKKEFLIPKSMPRLWV